MSAWDESLASMACTTRDLPCVLAREQLMITPPPCGSSMETSSKYSMNAYAHVLLAPPMNAMHRLCSPLKGLMGMSRLQKLGLAWNKGVTDGAIEKLCGEMNGLIELDLALCSNITCRSLRVRVGRLLSQECVVLPAGTWDDVSLVHMLACSCFA